jgi:hypothetical protein
MNSGAHIIQKQQFDIKTSRQKTAMDIQQRLDTITAVYMSPSLAGKLDDRFSDDKVITIERMEIDLGKIKANTTNDEWTVLITEKIIEQLDIYKNEAGVNVKTGNSYITGNWIYFLKHGILPADSAYRSVAELLVVLLGSGRTEKNEIRDFFLNDVNENILQRLVSNTDAASLKFHFDLLLPQAPANDFYWLQKEFDHLVLQLRSDEAAAGLFSTASIYRLLWVFVLKKLISSTGKNLISARELSNEALFYAAQLMNKRKAVSDKENIDRNFIKTPDPGGMEMPPATNKEIVIDEQESSAISSLPATELFVSNAGLCLVANWLLPFLTETELVKSGSFINEEKQQHAIFLLHFLATGEMQPTEELLLLPKLLCGWPLQMPAINSLPFTTKEITECDDLLKSVIQHWPALKNTSPEGLQESFLQRPGKLTENEEHFLLQPEQHSIDILLDQVPWNFQFTKLPWMKKPLQAEWY